MNSLNALNEYLKLQSPRQRMLLYISAGILVFGLAYLLFFSDVIDEYNSKNAILAQKELELKKLKNASGKKRIVELRQSIEDEKQDILIMQDKANATYKKIKNMSFFVVNDSNFAKLLKGALKNANDLKVNIYDVSIDTDKKPYIGVLKVQRSVTITGSGRFLNILDLIRYVESQKFLIKMDYMNVTKTLPEDENEKNNNNEEKKKKREKIGKKDVYFKVNFKIIGGSLS